MGKDIKMDDWRLRGQEEYLKGLTFYKVSFPEFWKKAFDEKNAFYQMISTEAHRFVEQMRRGEEYLEGEKIQHFWHEHCEFCWEKATTDKECVFYCTKDMRYWVCPDCFIDFKKSFGWVEKDSTELFDEHEQ